eukprot:m.311752 g.311752  ORF g.311752 m.311752 type:complete len:139 (+) comp139569_c0_seq1:28-444(+)
MLHLLDNSTSSDISHYIAIGVGGGLGLIVAATVIVFLFKQFQEARRDPRPIVHIEIHESALSNGLSPVSLSENSSGAQRNCGVNELASSVDHFSAVSTASGFNTTDKEQSISDLSAVVMQLDSKISQQRLSVTSLSRK